MWIFLRTCQGILHFFMAGISVEVFLVSVSHEMKQKTSQKFQGKFGAFGRKFGIKILKFGEFSFCNFSDLTEKSTLWTDAGVDQNFQRDLGAIGPYESQGNSCGPISWRLILRGNLNGRLENSSKVSPETGIGPWMALPCMKITPRNRCRSSEEILRHLHLQESKTFSRNYHPGRNDSK